MANRYQDTMGFTVLGPRHFLGSGHPDAREQAPSRLGLIESTDAGGTWTALSLRGQADFHTLQATHGRVYGFDSASRRLMVSADRRTWEPLSSLPIADFAVDPSTPQVLLAASEQGLARSGDGGRTFAPVPGAPAPLALSWPRPDALFAATASGELYRSADGGARWQRQGSLPGAPEALTALDADRLYAATDAGIHASTDGGRTFQLRYDTR